MAKSRHHNPKPAPAVSGESQLIWTPLWRLSDARMWRAAVTRQGGRVVGILWTAQKWPWDSERPIRIGFSEWTKTRPHSTLFAFEVWRMKKPGLSLMLRRACRSTLLMYGSWWVLAMFLGIDMTRNLWVQAALMGGVTIAAAWASYRILHMNRWIIHHR